MNMPKVQPIPIETKGHFILVRIWRWITSIRNWELLEDWEYDLPGNDPTIIIPKGFVFNGASVPRIFWSILSPTGLLFIPGLVHDYAYSYDCLWALDSSGKVYKWKEGSGRLFWDSIFRKVAIDVNGMTFIDILVWLGLVMFGWWGWFRTKRLPPCNLKPDKPTA
ncbi:MAG: DUF1353 domain-containing protein [Proteobacteria bacterium]|nr:DUF1353 domain-containing protein [Pseudomonadota bacterium]